MSQLTQPDSLNPRYEESLRLHRCWIWFLLLGMVLMIVGVLAISSPYLTEFTTFTTIFICGILLMVGGVVEIVNAFLARSWRGFFGALRSFFDLMDELIGDFPAEVASFAALLHVLFQENRSPGVGRESSRSGQKHVAH